MRQGGSRRASPSCRSLRLIRISPLPSVRMWSGRRHILRIRLAVATEPARGFHALFERCEAAVCAAATRPTTVNRAPGIVLSFAWSDKHSCCSDNTEHEDKSHQSSPIAGLLIGSTIKSRPVGTLIWLKVGSFLWPPAASRRPGPSRNKRRASQCAITTISNSPMSISTIRARRLSHSRAMRREGLRCAAMRGVERTQGKSRNPHGVRAGTKPQRSSALTLDRKRPQYSVIQTKLLTVQEAE
jgi:hypothetical protein